MIKIILMDITNIVLTYLTWFDVQTLLSMKGTFNLSLGRSPNLREM